MIKTPRSEIVFFKNGKQSLIKAIKYTCYTICSFLFICFLVLVFIPDSVINNLFKNRMIKYFEKNYPAYSLQIGRIHYNFWKDRFGCDSIAIKNSEFTCTIASFSISRIGWMEILWQRNINLKSISNSAVDVSKLKFYFDKSQNVLSLKTLHLSIPDSLIRVDSIKYNSAITDEQIFAESKFRQTRFRFEIPRIKIEGVDYNGLLLGNIYKAGNISLNDVYADILVNMDKPYDKNSSNPQMPNEALSSIKENIKVNNVKIINGRLKYCERFKINEKPGIVTFDKVNLSISGIANHTDNIQPAVINGEGIFMNSAKMKLNMIIPLTSRVFSLHYSGTLSSMDVTELNSFIVKSENRKIKSGKLQSAAYDIDVNSGHANGTLRVAYKDLSLAILDKNTESEKGIFNRIVSVFGKIFIIRGNNMPDSNGQMKIGEIKYTRDPEDYFIQYLWFALRNGVGDVVGFPQKGVSNR